MPYYVHKHQVAQQYGGPEEGGWYYEVGVPVEDWKVEEFKSEDYAYEVCRALNESEHDRRKKEEDYEYTSVLAHRSRHFSFTVEDFPVPVSYPEVRPHYE